MKRNLFDGLGIEALENRTMMAGDVGATLAGGDLVLNGDNFGNEVAIRATDQAGEYVVEGLNGTTINGQASAVLSGVNDDFRINLRNGDNVLLLTAEGPDGEQPDLVVPDDIQIRTGSGEDVVVFDNVRVSDDTSINTGDGSDTVITYQTTLEDDMRVNMGGGDDLLGFDTTEMNGRLRASMGSGDDAVVAFDSVFNDRSDMNMGSGNDFGGFSDSVFVDELRINGGSGDDTVFNDGSDFLDDLSLRSVEVAEDVAAADISDRINDYPGVIQGVELIFAEGTGF